MDDKQGRCQCICEAHYVKDELTPNGNPGHAHDHQFFRSHLEMIETKHGHFIVCKECANDCYALARID